MVTAREDKQKDAPRLIDRQRSAHTPAAADKGPERLAALRALSAPVPGMQDRAPRQPARVVERVFSNRAFEDFPLRVQEARHHIYPPGLEGLVARHWKKTTPAEIYLKKAEAFLRNLFPSLTAIPGIAFAPATETAATEEWVLKQATDSFQSAGLDGQAWQLSNAYNALRALRQVFAREAEAGGASPLETAIPVRYLPELLLAAPVWFVLHRGRDRKAAGADCEAVRYFCDLMPSAAFAALFQIYNGFPRGFSSFTGADPMPLPLARLCAAIKEHFEFLVIATPYHEEAATPGKAVRPWVSMTLPEPVPRQVFDYHDPFLFGFTREVPDQMFFLGRWSGTGFFPLITDMIAETLIHLRNSRHLLDGPWKQQFKWHMPLPVDGDQDAWRGTRAALPVPALPAPDLHRFPVHLFAHFQQGTLFDWLRGEVSIDPPLPVKTAG